MAESIASRINASKLDGMSERELRAILLAALAAINNLATKLDADAALTAKDYVASTKAILIK